MLRSDNVCPPISLDGEDSGGWCVRESSLFGGGIGGVPFILPGELITGSREGGLAETPSEEISVEVIIVAGCFRSRSRWVDVLPRGGEVVEITEV